MSELTIRIGADGSELDAALGKAQGQIRGLSQLEREAIQDSRREMRSLFSEKERLANEEKRLKANLLREQVRLTQNALREETRLRQEQARLQKQQANEAIADAKRELSSIFAEKKRWADQEKRLNKDIHEEELRAIAEKRKSEQEAIADARSELASIFAEKKRWAQDEERLNEDLRRSQLQDIAELRRAESDEIAQSRRDYRGIVEERKRAEDEATRQFKRQMEERLATAKRYGSMIGRALATGAWNTGTQVHGDIQSLRTTEARRESTLDTAMLQIAEYRSAPAKERAVLKHAVREQIHNYTRDPKNNFVDEDQAIELAEQMQGRYSAFSDAGGLQVGVRKTLEDINLGMTVNRKDPGGVAEFGAMLRQKGVGDETRGRIMSNALSSTFAGSAEFSDALRAGMPAMMTEITSATSHAKNPGEVDRITERVVADFMARLESEMTMGGTSRLHSNRDSSLAASMANPIKMDELGSALAHQGFGGDKEKKKAFDQAFHRGRDGHYSLDDSLQGSPDKLSSLLAKLFGGDENKAIAFLGPNATRLTGQDHQLLKGNEARDLVAYWGKTNNPEGQSVRGYELVEQLRNRHLGPDDIEHMREDRRNEGASKLLDNQKAFEDALLRSSKAVQTWSDSLADWTARHPVLATAAPAIVGAVVGNAGAAAGGAVAKGAASAVVKAAAKAAARRAAVRAAVETAGSVGRAGAGAAGRGALAEAGGTVLRALTGPVAIAVGAVADILTSNSNPRSNRIDYTGAMRNPDGQLITHTEASSKAAKTHRQDVQNLVVQNATIHATIETSPAQQEHVRSVGATGGKGARP